MGTLRPTNLLYGDMEPLGFGSTLELCRDYGTPNRLKITYSTTRIAVGNQDRALNQGITKYEG